MRPPLISVILPTYNRANLLPRAVASVIAQAADDLELIVIDDGSTDDTVQVIQDMSDERIRLIHFETNHGIGHGRNVGVEQARGRLIAFIDSDDLWLPGKLEHQCQVMTRYPEIELLFGNYENINLVDNSSDLGFNQTQRSLSMLKTRQLDDEVFQVESGMPEALLEGNFFATPTVVFRSEIVTRFGNYNTRLSGPEDFEFWWRNSVKGTRFAFTTRTLIKRYKDNDSITAQSIRFTPRFLLALDFCEQTARDSERPDLLPHLRRAKQRAWLGLARAHALEGQPRPAWSAYRQSLRYGLSSPGLLYIAAAVIGKANTGRLRAFRRKLIAAR